MVLLSFCMNYQYMRLNLIVTNKQLSKMVSQFSVEIETSQCQSGICEKKTAVITRLIRDKNVYYL